MEYALLVLTQDSARGHDLLSSLSAWATQGKREISEENKSSHMRLQK